jgi:hypothetical protein
LLLPPGEGQHSFVDRSTCHRKIGFVQNACHSLAVVLDAVEHARHIVLAHWTGFLHIIMCTQDSGHILTPTMDVTTFPPMGDDSAIHSLP